MMMAINGGCYHAVPIPDPKLGPRKVEVETMYNVERYRPSYDKKLGLPIFLTRADPELAAVPLTMAGLRP